MVGTIHVVNTQKISAVSYYWKAATKKQSSGHELRLGVCSLNSTGELGKQRAWENLKTKSLLQCAF